MGELEERSPGIEFVQFQVGAGRSMNEWRCQENLRSGRDDEDESLLRPRASYASRRARWHVGLLSDGPMDSRSNLYFGFGVVLVVS